MKKILTLSLITLAVFSAKAFTVLTTPESVLANSFENVAGAKATFQSVLDNSAATEEEIADALHVYEQQATPAPGYAFDMSFLLSYNAVTDDNKGKYTKAALAAVYKSDIEAVKPDANTNAFMVNSTTTQGLCMRIYSATDYQNTDTYGKFAIYQTAELTAGAYELQAKAAVAGLAYAAQLAANDNLCDTKIKGGALADYSVDFKIASTTDVKLGFVRNSTAGKLTHIYFNDMYLYKISDVVTINNDATGALAAAEGVNVLLERTFDADKYYPICLPFKVENWRETFDDLLLWNSYADGKISFSTVQGENTQARKPYLVKMKEDITSDNYLRFDNVTVESGNAGSWINNSISDIKMIGNWAAGTVPANSYYFDNVDNTWLKSDGTAHLPAFSAYMLVENDIDSDVLSMAVNGSNTGIENIITNDDATVNVYNTMGIVVKRGVSADEALNGLPRGIYIVNGKKFIK